MPNRCGAIFDGASLTPSTSLSSNHDDEQVDDTGDHNGALGDCSCLHPLPQPQMFHQPHRADCRTSE